MDRLEYKYLVSNEQLTELRRAVSPFVEVDKYARNERREYTVHSIYFDTPALDYYHQKMAGIQYRKKIRIRGYNDQQANSPVFLEIKRKENMAISKNRAPVLFKDANALLETGDTPRYVMNHNGFASAAEDARRFLYHVYRYSLHPVALISYEREAFFYRFDDSVRITFDKNLRSVAWPGIEDLFNGKHSTPSLGGHFVLEIKFHKGMPSWIKTILNDLDLERTAVSKYTICLDTQGIPRQPFRRPAPGEFSNGPATAYRDLTPPSLSQNRFQDPIMVSHV